MPDPPFPNEVGLALELALGSSATFLGQLREALTLAGVLALAGMIAALAGALALAGVRADAVAFASSVGNGRHGRASQEQGGSSSSESSTGLRSNLHVCLQKGVFIKDAPTTDRENSRPTDLHPGRTTFEFHFGYAASKFIFSASVFTQYLQRIGLNCVILLYFAPHNRILIRMLCISVQ
jgi:hypothetical protein